jgi:hypothetical protein
VAEAAPAVTAAEAPEKTEIAPLLATTPASATQPPATGPRRPTGSALYPMPALPDDPGPDNPEDTAPARRFFS